MIAIRGAVFVDANTAEDIYEKTTSLLKAMMADNQVELDNIIDITFSVTKDLTKAYPAVAARKLGIKHAALFCVQEMFVEGSADMCIRVMLHVDDKRKQQQVKHVYQNGAERLRPDLFEKEDLKEKA